MAYRGSFRGLKFPPGLGCPKADLLVPAALALLTFVLRLRLPPVIGDDAYITFRYAENIVRGLGFVYNEGEHVLGTTTPLFTLILALLSTALDISPGVTSHWISAASDAATVSILCALSLALLHRVLPGALAGLLFMLSPLATRFSINGMETAFAVALILLAMLAHLRHRDWAAGVLLGLAILARPEALLLALIVAAEVASRSLKRLMILLGFVLIVIAPWICFAYLYFGSPLANSVSAKSAMVYQWTLDQTVSMFLSHFAFLFVGYPLARFAGVAWPGAVPDLGSVAGWSLAIILAVLQGSLLLIGFRHIRRGRLTVASFPALYLLFYVASGFSQVLIFDWYLAPLQPFYLFFLAAGLLSLVQGALSRVTVSLIGGFLVLSLLTGLQWTTSPLGLPLDASADRESLYREVAMEYAPLFGHEDTVAASEIGAFGYFSGARILDTVGLVSPVALSYYPLPSALYESSYAIPPALIQDTRPEYIVTMEVFISHGLMRMEWFRAEYQEIDRRYSSAFRGTYLLVFRRIGSALESPPK